jgi:glutathione-independent formaldehyde dehydrogenase
VYGAGPVGLLSAYSAFLRGASEVFVVDRALERLERARSIGAVPVDFTKGNPAEQIKEIRKRSNRRWTAPLRIFSFQESSRPTVLPRSGR